MAYCITRARMGSKKRCTSRAKATIVPSSRAPVCSILPPTTISMPKAMAVSTSTVGIRLAVSLLALRLAFRCSAFSSSNWDRLTFSRFMLWVTRTPVMFS